MLTDGIAILDRMVSAVDKVRDRLLRATAAFDRFGIPHAVLGGNAVFLWIERHGEVKERFTPNVDLLIYRVNLAHATEPLISARFVGDAGTPGVFRDGAGGSPRTRLRLLFAGEKVRPAELLPNPGVSSWEQIAGFHVLPLPALVQTKLTANRTIDRVHLRDLLDVGLIDETWVPRYPAELGERLQMLIDTPDG